MSASAEIVRFLPVTKHAVERYRQRTGSKQTDYFIAGKLNEMVFLGKEVFLKTKFKALALINHDFAEARYFKRDTWIVVVENDVIVTIHEGTANRWE